jgi:hypothetical protein
MSNQEIENSDQANWPSSGLALADYPGFYVVFHGLFAFAYNREENICEVGTHAKNDEHKFAMFILEAEGGYYNLLYSFVPDSPSDVKTPIVLKVENSVHEGVSFHRSETAADEDWAHLPDIEGRYFYKNKVGKVKSAMKPRLSIHNGLFFTALNTAPKTFDCIDEETHEPKYHLGPVAYMPAVELSHNNGGYLAITFEKQEIRLASTNGKSYIIFFANLCPDCKWDPCSWDKKERNDFYLHYKLFKKPSGHPEYGLMLSDKTVTEPTDKRTAFFNYLVTEVLGKLTPLSSKSSPCGGIGFGMSMGIG